MLPPEVEGTAARIIRTAPKPGWKERRSPMPAATAQSVTETQLTHEAIDELMAHPYWASLGPELDALIQHIPAERPECERTTILTWIYGQQGVMSFLELADRITGFQDVTRKKRHVRGVLRGLEKLQLVSVVNFQTGEGEPPDDDGVIGSTSLVSLTGLGMVWMSRAWNARARLHPGTPQAIARVHADLVEEEDDGKANEPYWIENMPNRVSGEGPAARAARIADAVPGITSVFDLASRV